MILVLLPAFNEERSLPVLMPKIIGALSEIGEEFRVVVCNDGSTDNTHNVLDGFVSKMPVEVIEHKINRGLGETSRDLFERASELTKEGDVIIRLDCDDTHEAEYLAPIVRKVRSGFDVVIASRFEKGGDLPPKN